MVFKVMNTAAEILTLIMKAMTFADVLGDEAHPNFNTWKVRRVVPVHEHVCTIAR